jgi:hypothetical protein
MRDRSGTARDGRSPPFNTLSLRSPEPRLNRRRSAAQPGAEVLEETRVVLGREVIRKDYD